MPWDGWEVKSLGMLSAERVDGMLCSRAEGTQKDAKQTLAVLFETRESLVEGVLTVVVGHPNRRLSEL